MNRRRVLGPAAMPALGVLGAACARGATEADTSGRSGWKTGITLGWHSNSAGRIYEVRSDTAYFEDIRDVKIPEEMMDLAEHIIDKKKGKFDPDRFEDRYEEALKEMLAAKQEGRTIKAPKDERPSNVINLMDALRKSIEADKGGKAAKSTKATARPKAKSKTRGAKKTVAKKPAKRRAAG